MSDLRFFDWMQRRSRVAIAVLVLGLVSLISSRLARSDEPKPGARRGPTVGTSVTKTATLFRRAGSDTTWHIVAQNEKLQNEDLLVGLPGAMLDSENGAVRLALLADLDQLSPYPIKESAVRLQDNRSVDLALTLDRGRIELVNRKKDGAATAKISVRKDTWDMVLAEPGTRIALELYGRWPRGVPFREAPDPKHEPLASLVFLVLQGQVTLKHKGNEHALQAPPGPALMEWDSVSGHDDAPQRLEDLPPWAKGLEADSSTAKAKKAVLERFRQAVEAKSIDGALDEFGNSENQQDRTLAIYVMAALDRLSDLGKAFRETKHPDVLETSVLALRHWIGRGPGQDQILYKGLIETAHYKPVLAATALQLLHSFGEQELASPETYQCLIDYLDHDTLGIRELAYWHLYRLVPAGRKIGYNPLDSKEARAVAVQQWRKLLPPGQLPPRPMAERGKQ